jgi:plasmid maintenance system killer protein
MQLKILAAAKILEELQIPPSNDLEKIVRCNKGLT